MSQPSLCEQMFSAQQRQYNNSASGYCSTTTTRHNNNNNNNNNNKQAPTIKMVSPSQTSADSSQVQRKLCGFFYIYAILIISLYATYAAYYFYQHHQLKQKQQQQQDNETSTDNSPSQSSSSSAAAAAMSHSAQSLIKSATDQFQERTEIEQMRLQDLETKLESKIHLLERYIEVIAVDLQETKNKLKEREKCDCSTSCTFNGTRYQDRSSWQQQCDTCTCQSGRISCLPQKCPQLNCDDAIQLPGQCCPTCMKKCRYNNQIVRHGQKFNPLELSSKSQPALVKECKCYNGLIKCEQIQRKSPNVVVVSNAIRFVAQSGSSSSNNNNNNDNDNDNDKTVANTTTTAQAKDSEQSQMTGASVESQQSRQARNVFAGTVATGVARKKSVAQAGQSVGNKLQPTQVTEAGVGSEVLVPSALLAADGAEAVRLAQHLKQHFEPQPEVERLLRENG